MRIDDFKAVISPTEFLRTNKFKVMFVLPIGSTPESVATSNKMQFYTDKVSVAGANIQVKPSSRYGYGVTENRPVNAIFRDINMDVLNDGENNNLRLFRRWLNMIYPFDMSRGLQSNTYTLTYRDNYVTDLHIFTYDEGGFTVSHMIYRDAFPIGLDPLAMSWNDRDSIQKIGVTWTYTDWHEEPITQG